MSLLESPLFLNRTKIVATVGPASSSPDQIRRMITAGVNVFRLNFSHGTHEDHTQVLQNVRSISREMQRHVGILQDLCGPKMRLGPIPDEVVDCPLGEEFFLVTERMTDSPRELTCSYTTLPNDLNIGETILFADGTVAMQVVGREPGKARLIVTLPGRLRTRQGLNMPNSELNVPALTAEDLNDLDWTARFPNDVQYVGLSFVRSVSDVKQLRAELERRNCPARIIVKIEKPQAVKNLDAIIAESDAVMVARGDLGVEMDVHRVPAIQKRIISACNRAHRPVITATQMLNSMEHSSRPTRAEASDVFNAVLDGTDAVMLSGESAIGKYPVEAVTTMSQICVEAENSMADARPEWLQSPSPSLAGLIQPITEATVDAVCLAAEQLNAPVIVAMTASGRTALAISNRRPSSTILALTLTEQTACALSVCWGVVSLVAEKLETPEQAMELAADWAKEQKLVKPGQHIVLLRGELPGPVNCRAIHIRQVS